MSLLERLLEQTNPNPSPGSPAFRDFLNRLPEDCRKALGKPGKAAGPSEPRYCLCEFPEGDWPRVRLFRSRQMMLERLRSLEGQEVGVWIFYGWPLQFTAQDDRGRRYVCLPDGQKVVAYDAPGELLDPPDLDLQEDGWMGPPELTEPVIGGYLQWDATQRTDDEDEEDDEEEDDDDDEIGSRKGR